ncbi:hypothetical protein ACFYZ2_21075 [Streptomyces sviceus]
MTFTAKITVSPMLEDGEAAMVRSHHQVGVCVQWGSETYCVGVYAE